jgi:phage/plasmid-like protein (TIGR03299 family)
MPAGLEASADGTQVAFASSNADAWHRLGTDAKGAMTAQQALELAHLDNWDVRKVPVFGKVPTGDGPDDFTWVQIPQKFGIVRNDPFEPGMMNGLGTVGRYYEPVQNEDQADLLNTLVSESGAHFETAGSLDDGKRVFISMKLPSSILFDGLPVDESTELYLIALDSKDGSTSFQFVVSPIRPVCSNTVAAALANAKSRFRARHTKGSAKAHVLEARRILGLTFQYVEALDIELEKLVGQDYTDQQFQRLTASLYPTPKGVDPESAKATNMAAHRDSLRSIWDNSPTLTNIRGTRWGAYNAVTEYVDHYNPMRGAKGRDPEVSRALQVVSGFADKTKERAFALLAQ